MAISPFSRYADNTVISLSDNEGVSRPTILITPPGQQIISFATYAWKLGDRIEYLAYSVYGDEQSWWLIANANPEILFWDNLTPGTEVRLPNA